jgi:hypothetical protein
MKWNQTTAKLEDVKATFQEGNVFKIRFRIAKQIKMDEM